MALLRLQAMRADFAARPTPKAATTPYVNPFKPTEAPTPTTTSAPTNPFASPSAYQNPFTTQNTTGGYSNPFDNLGKP